MLNWVQNLGRPDYDLGNDDKIHEADEHLEQSMRKRKELEDRLRLLEIQGTPRGPLHG